MLKSKILWIGCCGLVSIFGCTVRRTFVEPVSRMDESTLLVQKNALNNLKFATAQVLDFPEQLHVSGKISITEDRTTVVPARVTGRIESIKFASGEFVKEGQLLLTLFSPDFVAAKEEYVQALRQSKTSFKNSDPSDFANLAQMSRKKLEVLGLSHLDINDLSEQNTKEAFLNIRAPRSGVIVAKGATLGNFVNVGDTLFTIGDLSKVWFSGDIYPEDLPKVKKGQNVMITVEGLGKPVYGTVSFISPIVDPSSRSIKFRALMDNPEGYLRADMYVQGGVTISDRKALLVPTMSLVRDADNFFVFRRQTEKTIEGKEGGVVFKKVSVTPGPERQNMTAIVDGIKDGDEIVSDGALLLDGVLSSTGS